LTTLEGRSGQVPTIFAMQVILVRHGQTDWNREGIFRGRIDVKLNASGLREAEIIGEALRGADIDAVCSSPLSRALETALRIAPDDGPVEALDEFTDMDFGAWQGLPREQVRKRYPELYDKWVTTPERVRIPGAETLGGVRRRALEGLDSLLEKHSGETVVIVSHGLVNKVLLCAVLGLEDSHFWKIKQDNGAINLFTYTREGTKLVMLNDTTHLRGVASIVESMKSPENPLG
jgi:broad specificity phosphatase PhoE